MPFHRPCIQSPELARRLFTGIVSLRSSGRWQANLDRRGFQDWK